MNQKLSGGVTKRKKRPEASERPSSSREAEEDDEDEDEPEAGTSQVDPKKQKRQEANRASALLSKAKKAQHEQSLNLRLASHEEEGKGIQLRIAHLKEDEMKLKQHVAVLSTHQDHYNLKLREAMEMKQSLEGLITSIQEQQGLERKLPQVEETFPLTLPSTSSSTDCPLPPPPFRSNGYGALLPINMIGMVPGVGMGLGSGPSWASSPLPLPFPLPLPTFSHLHVASLLPSPINPIASTLIPNSSQAQPYSSHYTPPLTLPLAMLSLREPQTNLPLESLSGHNQAQPPPQPSSGGHQRGSMKPGLLSLSLTSQPRATS